MWRVDVSEKAGRHIVASEPISVGTTILTEKPFIYVPLNLKTCCVYCLSGGALQVCSYCQCVSFCSKECQKRAWNDFHKNECHILTSNMNPDVILILRLVNLKLMNRLHRTPFEQLKGHSESNNSTLNLNLKKVALTVSRILKHAFTNSQLDALYSPETIYRWLSILDCNIFSITDESLEEIGHGLYLRSSFINHSCLRNAVANFHVIKTRRPAIVVQCAYDIQTNEEVCISYIDPKVLSKRAADRLQEQYKFKCTCNFCENDLARKAWDTQLQSPLKKPYYSESNNNSRQTSSEFTDDEGTKITQNSSGKITGNSKPNNINRIQAIRNLLENKPMQLGFSKNELVIMSETDLLEYIELFIPNVWIEWTPVNNLSVTGNEIHPKMTGNGNVTANIPVKIPLVPQLQWTEINVVSEASEKETKERKEIVSEKEVDLMVCLNGHLRRGRVGTPLEKVHAVLYLFPHVSAAFTPLYLFLADLLSGSDLLINVLSIGASKVLHGPSFPVHALDYKLLSEKLPLHAADVPPYLSTQFHHQTTTLLSNTYGKAHPIVNSIAR
eukprot:Platyproteum_vivax@DN6897_c0_g1_i1.p1